MPTHIFADLSSILGDAAVVLLFISISSARQNESIPDLRPSFCILFNNFFSFIARPSL